jgi:hypothetical protein
MRRSLLLVALVGLVLPVCMPSLVPDAGAWGFYAHKRINRMAAFTLPPALFPFFKRHLDFITDHAVDPDRRRYAVEGEAERHYIDIDHYGHGAEAFANMPRKWDDAVRKYSEDTLRAYGIVPWQIEIMYERLVRAMKRGDVDRILKYATDLGHYVADAHVPLHTTENYNGQLTGQHGIHAFWESRIPEVSAENYDHLVGRAEYVSDVLSTAWEAVEESHSLLDSVLAIEKRLDRQFAEDRKYTFEDRGRGGVRTWSREYTLAYEAAMGGMVESRMNAAIRRLGDIWYSAWVDAGQPDLMRFDQREVSDSLKRVLKAEEEMWKAGGRGFGREHE